ncbi:MAG: ribonuclease catalytic domain-containing protein, partial [Treponemataceae bacterium]
MTAMHFETGSLVLYKNNPALIVTLGEKYTIAFLNSQGNKRVLTTQKVRQKDISLLSSLLFEGKKLTEKDLFSLYNDYEKIDLSSIKQVWQLYEGESQNIFFSELVDLLVNNFTCIMAWTVYNQIIDSFYFEEVTLQGEEVSFKTRPIEDIEQLQKKNNDKKKESEIRQAFLSRLQQKKLQFPEDLLLMQEVESLALGKSEKSKTLKEIGLAETCENAHALLLETGVWTIYKNPYPARYGLSMHSSKDLLSSPPQEQRLALNHHAYAIDNAWSADPDDAIFFDGEALWVHIADPASTVSPNSIIDINARNRGATLYLPEGTARMLNENCLSDYALGLSNPSKALSFKIFFDETGAITDCNVIKSLVEVERLTYTQAEQNKNLQPLKDLFDIARRNINRRKKNGAIFIDLPEVHLVVNGLDEQSTEKIVNIEKIEPLEAQDMVREMMLLAGEAAAKFAFKHEIPFPYISQDIGDIPKKIEEGLAGQYRLRRCMRPRIVGVTPSKHSGLGIGMYSQVTSPLRRYADLLAHQQLRSFIDKKTLLTKDEVLAHASVGNMASSAGVKAERKSTLHWTLVYLMQNPSWQADAIVVEVQPNKTVL